jgi:predicted nucleic acid-binding protein
MDRRDADHTRCAALLRDAAERILVPGPVLVETEWLAASRLGPAPFEALLTSVERNEVQVVNLEEEDYPRIRAIMARYADLPLGFVDAAVVALAERLSEPKVATLDRRHFSVVRPAHVPALRLLPE